MHGLFYFSKMNPTDKKGIVSFLIITFVLTYLIEFALISGGVSPIMQGLGQYVVALVMWVPALAAFITVKFITKEDFKILRIRFGSWKPYLLTALLIPACYLIIYIITYFLNFGQPDWQMNHFKSFFEKEGIAIPAIPNPSLTWGALYFTTLLFAPIINGLFGFGEELGWRGYLLFKLMPLGKWKAYSILAIIWGLWHLPLILVGFMYPGYPYYGIILFCILTFGLGLFMNELTIRYKSAVLAGWVHGLFNSQRLGIWTILFPDVNPLLGGYNGLVGLAIWILLGIITMRYFRHNNYQMPN